MKDAITLTPTFGTILTTPVTFPKHFTVVPKASVILTGFNRRGGVASQSGMVGLVISIGSITTTGFDFSVDELFTYNFIYVSYVATQGDHLQVFLLETTLQTPTSTPIMIPFPYSNLQFDSNNPPV